MKGSAESVAIGIGVVLGIAACHVAPRPHHSYYDPYTALKNTLLGVLLLFFALILLFGLARVKGLLGWVPLAIAIVTLITIGVLAICILAYNLPYIF